MFAPKWKRKGGNKENKMLCSPRKWVYWSKVRCWHTGTVPFGLNSPVKKVKTYLLFLSCLTWKVSTVCPKSPSQYSKTGTRALSSIKEFLGPHILHISLNYQLKTPRCISPWDIRSIFSPAPWGRDALLVCLSTTLHTWCLSQWILRQKEDRWLPPRNVLFCGFLKTENDQQPRMSFPIGPAGCCYSSALHSGGTALAMIPMA